MQVEDDGVGAVEVDGEEGHDRGSDVVCGEALEELVVLGSHGEVGLDSVGDHEPLDLRVGAAHPVAHEVDVAEILELHVGRIRQRVVGVDH